MNEKKYYWLKLPKDFFKRHDIKFIKTLPHGYEIVLFYLELMAESIDHEGELRFSPKIPYTEEMLASATDTDIEIVRMAMQTLKELDLVTVSKNGTIKLEKVASMIGFETKWAEKKRAWREQQKQNEDKTRTPEGQEEDNVLDMSSQCPDDVLTLSDKSKRQSKSKSKRQSKETELKTDTVIQQQLVNGAGAREEKGDPPSLLEVCSYIKGEFDVLNATAEAEKFIAWNAMRGWSCLPNWQAAADLWCARIGERG